jgi:Cu(I)/Ag(I) efflux system membrane protein CusA/SilA
LFGWGLFAVRHVPIDAIPDLSENQVIVFADWEGRSPQEIEDQITYPLSVNLQGLAGVRSVRASSMFGFSLITVIFEDNVDNYFARTRVLERLNYLGNLLPAGVTPRLGPDATGLGWVYQYYLKVDDHPTTGSAQTDLGQLRALQDYFVRYQLAAVPGVAEVASIGGFVRQWQVEVSALRMRTLGITLQQMMDAIAASNLNVGGRTLEENGQEFVVRGRGLITSAADLESIALTVRDGTPLYLRDVARVQIGGDFRRGVLDVDGHEVVGGAVVMRSGENAYQVIKDVKARIAQISAGLPPGITIEPFYDRSSLIDRAIDTLKHTLWEAVLLVTLMHVIFLFHFRSILIVTLPLPASILVAFILMKQFGIQSHIMSLTGIAIAIGVLVDAAIVITENVIRHCELAEAAKAARDPGGPSRLTPAETWNVVLEASQQVGRPIFFAMGIIILAFIPIFQLTGQEGKLFHPLAWTKTFAMIGATILAVTLVPVLCTFLVRGPFRTEERNAVMRGLLAIYDPVLDWALEHRKTVIALASALLVFCSLVAFGLPTRWVTRLAASSPRLAAHLDGFGSEFMPTLQEGSLLFMPVLLPSTSLTEVKRIMSWQDRVIRETPEVASVAGKLGRFDTATDPAPTEMIETTIMLKPTEAWRPGMTKEKLIAELTVKLTQIPGYVPGFLQPIENRILMLSTGIRAQLGIKIFGDNPDALQQKAIEVANLVEKIPGATGVAPSRLQGKPYLEITVNRAAMARYGVSAADVLAIAETGLGGKTVSTSIQGRERWPIQLRLERADREDLDRLAAIPVATPAGNYVPLGQVATIERVTGPNEISSENGRLRAFVQANVTGRDLGSFVDDARRRIAESVTLAPGMTIEYSGQYENQLRARDTLRLIVPVVLAIIFVVLTLTFHSAAEAAHVILAVPFALTGGVLLQWAMGFNFSVAVWVGYIALFGTAIQTGVVMVIYLEEAVKQAIATKAAAASATAADVTLTHGELVTAIKQGARLRLRPKVMTVATAVAGLLPIFWSNRTGVEIMRPLAAPVVGGMLSSLIHILIVTPVIFAWLRERRSRFFNPHA